MVGTICQKCGDTGFFELLIYCNDCHLAAEHRYCLNELLESHDEEVIWSCEDCKRKAPKMASLNKLSFGICGENECEHGNLRSNDGAGSRYPLKKKTKRNKKRRHSISHTEAKAKVSSIRYPRDLFVDDACGSAGLTSHPSLPKDENECQRSLGETTEGDGKIKKPQQSLNHTSTDGSNRDFDGISCHETDADRYSYVHAQPIIDPVWRGCFNTHDHSYGMIASHLSNKACPKVYEGVKMLAPTLSVEMLPRADAWPKSFQRSPPTDDNIGLYFFPESARDEMVFYQLLHGINNGDLALKVILDYAELLIFSSLLFPVQHSRFRGKCYLWGVFKGRSVPLLQRPVSMSANDEVSMSACDENQDEKNSAKQTRKVHSWELQQTIGFDKCFPDNPENSIEGGLSLERPINYGEEKDGKQAHERSSYSTCDIDMAEDDNDELKLFPLEVEDMAVMTRMGRNGGLDLELGLGRPVGEDGEASIGCKPRTDGTADASLALDKAIF